MDHVEPDAGGALDWEADRRGQVDLGQGRTAADTGREDRSTTTIVDDGEASGDEDGTDGRAGGAGRDGEEDGR